MAKKQTTNEQGNRGERQSRKEILRAQKQAEQTRVFRIAALVVLAVILVVVVIAVVNEFILVPGRSVATVNGQPVTLREWQERVEYERAQRIIALESQLENFNGDIGLVQQFSGQAIVELINENAEGLGEAVLERMIDEEIMRQAAEERGLLPSEADVEARIGESFNYFGGDSPPAQPEPTETVAPTPSVTPIPAEGEDPVAAPDPTIAPGPTNPPPPTPTPVSAESFQQEFDQVLADFNELGVGEDTYRAVIESSIIMERLTDALAEYEELPGEDMHASVFFVAFSDQAEAEEALNEIEESDFLTVWNTIRSQPPDPETETESIATASEVLWRTRESYAGSFGEEVADAVFDLPLNTASGVLEITGTDGEPFYIVIQVSGREMRDLSEAELESRKQQLLISFLDEQRVDGVEMTELWRSRVPTSPVLDPKFRQPPTPTPDSGLDGLGTGDESPSP